MSVPSDGVKKRVFVGLVVGSILLLFSLALVAGYLARLGSFGRTIVVGLAWLAAGVAFISGLGVLGMVFGVWWGEASVLAPFIRFVLETLYPVTLRIGPCFGIPKDRVQLSFVAVSNELAKGRSEPVRPEKLLLLMPHCLQRAECTHKITIDVGNCQRCGGCQVGDLVQLSEEFGTKLAVATGGGMARKIIHDLHPQAVIAVACERDLTSGLLDSFPLPVYGIVNERPHGYCYNTGVDLDTVRRAVIRFLSGERR